MKTCSECNQPAEALFRSGLVENEVCKSCYDRLAAQAVKAACNPVGDKSPLQKQAVTADTVVAGVKEIVE